MTATRPLHLTVAHDGPARYDAHRYVALARLAERGALDFVTLGDSFARPALDARAVLSRVAPTTGRIGLVPTVTTTHTEPFNVSTAVATLDRVSRGRAGWVVGVSGPRPPGERLTLWRRFAGQRGKDGKRALRRRSRPGRLPPDRPLLMRDGGARGHSGLTEERIPVNPGPAGEGVRRDADDRRPRWARRRRRAADRAVLLDADGRGGQWRAAPAARRRGARCHETPACVREFDPPTPRHRPRPEPGLSPRTSRRAPPRAARAVRRTSKAAHRSRPMSPAPLPRRTARPEPELPAGEGNLTARWCVPPATDRGSP
ncbi:LLM class flavin-dependent oxidoreductase [Streptomyces sp. PmtA]|uniref:LLM class flavin-dependent oxidoreductase n=1 Tax=Streptomyces sp. PmtA TaxID=3074275 RepID=UPI003014732D